MFGGEDGTPALERHGSVSSVTSSPGHEDSISSAGLHPPKASTSRHSLVSSLKGMFKAEKEKTAAVGRFIICSSVIGHVPL